MRENCSEKDEHLYFLSACSCCDVVIHPGFMNRDEHILSSANCSIANEKRTGGQIVLDQMFIGCAIFRNTEMHLSAHTHTHSLTLSHTFNQSAVGKHLITFL